MEGAHNVCTQQASKRPACLPFLKGAGPSLCKFTPAEFKPAELSHCAASNSQQLLAGCNVPHGKEGDSALSAAVEAHDVGTSLRVVHVHAAKIGRVRHPAPVSGEGGTQICRGGTQSTL